MYKDVEVVSVEDVKLNEFNKDLVGAEIKLKVDNPNWYKVKLKKSELNVFVNGSDLGIMTLAEPITLPKYSQTVQTLTVFGNYEELQNNFLKNMLSLLFNSKVDLEAKGYVKGKIFLFPKKVPVEIKEQIDLKDIGL